MAYTTGIITEELAGASMLPMRMVIEVLQQVHVFNYLYVQSGFLVAYYYVCYSFHCIQRLTLCLSGLHSSQRLSSFTVIPSSMALGPPQRVC